ncbi:MAG TPA: ester cyclase, partial [Baekduia sp.]|nr:ester cyclase [Baekduia sp.]
RMSSSTTALRPQRCEDAPKCVRSMPTTPGRPFRICGSKVDDGPFLHPHAPRYSLAWRAVGTHTGPIDPPGFAPTGKRLEFPVWEISELRDGRASRVRIAIDMADVMRQLGLLAAPGSRAERAMATLQRLQMKVSRRR